MPFKFFNLSSLLNNTQANKVTKWFQIVINSEIFFFDKATQLHIYDFIISQSIYIVILEIPYWSKSDRYRSKSKITTYLVHLIQTTNTKKLKKIGHHL